MRRQNEDSLSCEAETLTFGSQMCLNVRWFFFSMKHNGSSISEVQSSGWIWAGCQRHEARYALLSAVANISRILTVILLNTVSE